MSLHECAVVDSPQDQMDLTACDFDTTLPDNFWAIAEARTKGNLGVSDKDRNNLLRAGLESPCGNCHSVFVHAVAWPRGSLGSADSLSSNYLSLVFYLCVTIL